LALRLLDSGPRRIDALRMSAHRIDHSLEASLRTGRRGAIRHLRPGLGGYRAQHGQ
jgi:hypothetical protein